MPDQPPNPAPRAEITRLSFRLPTGEILQFVLDRPALRIGRSRSNEICLVDPSISGRHADVSLHDGYWALRDLNSRNGIYVNGTRKHLCALRSGDGGRLGRVSFRFESSGGGDTETDPGASTTFLERPHVLCCKCRLPIFEDLFATGQALRLGESAFCPQCRHPLLGKEVAGHRLDDVLDPIGPVLVFRGLHAKTGEPRAVKLLLDGAPQSPQPIPTEEAIARTRFLREAVCLELLDHPGIVRVHEGGIWQHQFEELSPPTWVQTPWFAMEYIDGENLLRTVNGRGPLPAAEAVRLASLAAEALEHAASKGVVHRDLRPANFLLPRSGGVKLINFGLAKLMGAPKITQPKSALGPPGYIAAEQMEDPSKADFRSDLFSLGAVLFFALTGERPIETDSSLDYLQKVRQTPPPRVRDLLPDLPEELDVVLGKMMARDPRSRHASYAKLRKDLDRLQK
ncbi:MAG: protein kinase [Planctomycetes bacterium]|nr:protein kinase [Planctomycetota bacterium]